MPLSGDNGQIEAKRGMEQNAAELRFTQRDSTRPKAEEAWGHQSMGTIEERGRDTNKSSRKTSCNKSSMKTMLQYVHVPNWDCQQVDDWQHAMAKVVTLPQIQWQIIICLQKEEFLNSGDDKDVDILYCKSRKLKLERQVFPTFFQLLTSSSSHWLSDNSQRTFLEGLIRTFSFIVKENLLKKYEIILLH